MKNRMKLILFSLLIIPGSIFSQSDQESFDKKYRATPGDMKDYVEIARYLSKDLNNDKDKARSIYIWIAHNITYDLFLLKSNLTYFTTDELIDYVMKNRKGLCQHYSELFHSMCNSVAIKSFVISGFARQIDGNVSEISHAWNGVIIGSDYYFVDVTWAAGYISENKYIHEFRDDYFLIDPTVFIMTHKPFDPLWQFLDNPLTNQEFTRKDFSRLSKKGDFEFRDSIICYEKLGKLEKLQSANRRIIKSGITNTLVQRQIDENAVQITNIKYNMAVDALNSGIDSYNIYISHKNNQFSRPRLADNQIKELIQNAEKEIYMANSIFTSLASGDQEMNDRILDARKKMPTILTDLEREKEFVTRYLKKKKPLRAFMFL